MSSKKAGMLSLLTGDVNCDSELPTPSSRTKRNHSNITALTDHTIPTATDKSFDLITRDPSTRDKVADSPSQRVKSRNFMEPIKSAITPDSQVQYPGGAVVGGYKLKTKRLSSENMEMCFSSRELVPFSNLEAKIQTQRRFWRAKSDFKGDFVIVGVVCHTWMKEIPRNEAKKTLGSPVASTSSSTKTTSESVAKLANKRKSFLMVVRLSDLKRTSVCLVLEPSLQAALAISFGDVLAILNPSFVNAVDGDGAVLRVKDVAQLCVLGQSAEIGVCTYRNPVRSVGSGSQSSEKALPSLLPLNSGGSERSEMKEKRMDAIKREAVCPNFINVEESDYCEFHMYEMFDHVKSARMVLNDASGGALARKKKRKEFSNAAKHLSDGIFVLLGLKWRISERGVKVVPSNEQGVLPTATEIDKITERCPRGGRNLKASVLGVIEDDTPEALLRAWRKEQNQNPSTSASTPLHPNALLSNIRKK